MTESDFRIIVIKAINNMDLRYLGELEKDINYYQTENFRYIKNELKSLFNSVKNEGEKQLKANWWSEEPHILSVVTSDMLFILKYCIRKDGADKFTIRECNEGIPF